MVFETFFGETLQKHKGEAVKTSELQDKTVMIYFSAHWCPPCRGFTPMLVEFYKNLKATRHDFELVFVSSDKDQHAFDEYFGEMPWVALPYDRRDLKEKLSSKFKVSGIPSLVVLDKDGSLITSRGRAEVMKDPKGESFPWIPQTLDQLLGTKFVTKSGAEVEKTLQGKVYGLYFSAHWCPPCRKFTPVLVAKFEQLKAKHPDFEIVFVSSDHDQGAFDEYLGEMPWVAIPFSDRKTAKQLGERFEVEGIPTLVIMDSDGSIITTEGVGAVLGDLEYPFRPPPLNKLSEENFQGLNGSPSLLVFTSEAQEAQVAATLQPIADEYAAGKRGVGFYYATQGGIVDAVRRFGNFTTDTPLTVIINIPAQAIHISERKEVTAENIRAFLADFAGGSLANQIPER